MRNRPGCHTILVTTQALEHEAWPRHAIDEFFMLPLPNLAQTARHHLRRGLPRSAAASVDRIVALDDYDVETAADLREHMRLPGMGACQARFFRDKLAIRVQAPPQGRPRARLRAVLNYDRVHAFMAQVPPPWVLKPRSEASSMGIKKIHHPEEVWRPLDVLGDRQSYYVLERFLPGDVFHVDSVVWDGEVRFAGAAGTGCRPWRSITAAASSPPRPCRTARTTKHALRVINRQLVAAMGMQSGVTHAEFIHCHEDGRYYFLEIAARVGGAGIDRLVEHATNVNPWVEWARVAGGAVRGEAYQLPPVRQEHAGLIVSLARQEWPDTSAYDDPEVVWRLRQGASRGVHRGVVGSWAGAAAGGQLRGSHRAGFHGVGAAAGAAAGRFAVSTGLAAHVATRHGSCVTSHW